MPAQPNPWMGLSELMGPQAEALAPRTDTQDPMQEEALSLTQDEIDEGLSTGTLDPNQTVVLVAPNLEAAKKTEQAKAMGPMSQTAVPQSMLDQDALELAAGQAHNAYLQQGQGITQLEQDMNQLRQNPQGGIDYNPFVSFAKMHDPSLDTNSAMAAANSIKPETAQERAMKLIKLQEMLQGHKDASAKTAFANLAAQLKARNATKTSPLDDALKKAKINAYNRGDLTQMLPGQKSMDQDFGKELSDWSASGGWATVQKHTNSLKSAMEQLKQNPSLSGGAASFLPESLGIKARISPDAVAIKQKIYLAVQSGLKAALGSAFTQKEGDDLMARSYDDALPAAQNIEKLQAAIEEIETKAKQKEAAAKYFEKTGGTLKGYKPTTARTEKYKVGDVVDGYRFKGGDWQDQNSWEKK